MALMLFGFFLLLILGYYFVGAVMARETSNSFVIVVLFGSGVFLSASGLSSLFPEGGLEVAVFWLAWIVVFIAAGMFGRFLNYRLDHGKWPAFLTFEG